VDVFFLNLFILEFFLRVGVNVAEDGKLLLLFPKIAVAEIGCKVVLDVPPTYHVHQF
jgi:hypothetical protein